MTTGRILRVNSESLRLSFGKHRKLIWLLLFLASVHCTRSIFFANVSLLNLPSYAAGTESMPFQGRIGMIPVVRWAPTNRFMIKAAAFMDASLRKTPHYAIPPERVTPEKLACIAIGIASVLVMTFSTTWFSQRRFPRVWWLGGVFVLLILYTTYAARAEVNFWYPYDLPHFAIFGGACIAILEGAWVPFLLIFILDMPFRETSIYLIPVAFSVALNRRQFRLLVPLSLVTLLVWLPFRLYIVHLFANNPTEVGVRWMGMFHAIVNPLHWSQLASAGGFLMVPLWLGRANLKSDERVFLYASVPGLLVTLLFGVWIETRIFDEWTVAIAILLTSESNSLLQQRFSGMQAPVIF